MSEQKALGLLGLAMRAGQVISGSDMVDREIRAGRAAYVLLDAGASDRTREKYSTMCEGRGIPLYMLSADALGKSIGRENRMVAVLRRGPLAKQLEALLNETARP